MNIQTVKHNKISFVTVNSPQELELKYLRNNFGFNQLNLDDYLNRTQIAQIEAFKEYVLVVLDFPYFEQQTAEKHAAEKKEQEKIAKQVNGAQNQKERIALLPELPTPHIPLTLFPSVPPKKKRIVTSHVNFFIGADYVVVLHDGATDQINEIFTLCQKTLRHRQEFMSESPVFLFYRIVDILVDNALAIVNDLSATTDHIDRQIANNKLAEVVEDISVTRRNIVVFQTMVKQAIPLFSDLENGKHPRLNGRMTAFWSNILDHYKKVWDRLEDNSELVEGIATSYESLLTVRTNEIIKVLTMFTAILLPLTLVASIYGMNIHLPFADNPVAFWIIIEIMVVLAVTMLFYFKLKHWL